MAALLVSDRILARALAIVGWIGLLLQLYLSIRTQLLQGRTAAFGVLMYLGYFTILSNGFCALVATAHALGRTPRPWVTSAATLSILMVGGIYVGLLRDQWNPQGLQMLVNVLMHYVVPPAFALFWWRAVPHGSLQWIDVGKLLAYPLAYLGYLGLRGELTGLYPYFFIDVSRIGYPAALVNAAGISTVFALSGWGLVAMKRARKASGDAVRG